MNTYKLQAPLKIEDVLKLRAGDVVYITGIIFSLRDAGHRKALEEKGLKMPGNVLYHCGPIVQEKAARKVGALAGKGNNWKLISAGPTTSARMDSVEGEFIRKYDIAAIIGKGGMCKTVAEAMKGRCVYLAFPGGCGALAAKKLRIASVQWLEELGMAEALWELRADEFGPLVVGIDARGNSLYM